MYIIICIFNFINLKIDVIFFNIIYLLVSRSLFTGDNLTENVSLFLFLKCDNNNIKISSSFNSMSINIGQILQPV